MKQYTKTSTESYGSAIHSYNPLSTIALSFSFAIVHDSKLTTYTAGTARRAAFGVSLSVWAAGSKLVN
ncbi:hypothetical protein HMPREF0156_00703 [Bacteroidetes oral taxon 274 str. F0058]|nr:hypothetical protein HMPREF0156_00703 [Bacteroidetes oral taxon 274 str. F0058]